MASVEAPPVPPAAAPEATPTPEPAAETVVEAEEAIQEQAANPTKSLAEKPRGVFGRAIDRYRSWSERMKMQDIDKQVFDAQVAYDEARADEERFDQCAQDLVVEIKAHKDKMDQLGIQVSVGTLQNMRSGLEELRRLKENAHQRAEELQEKMKAVEQAQQAQEQKADAVAERINRPYEVREQAFRKQHDILTQAKENEERKVQSFRSDLNALEQAEQNLATEIDQEANERIKLDKERQLLRIRQEKESLLGRLPGAEQGVGASTRSLVWLEKQIRNVNKKKVPLMRKSAEKPKGLKKTKVGQAPAKTTPRSWWW